MLLAALVVLAAAAAACRTPATPGAEGPRVEIEVGDAPVRGPRDAPVTLIEFSDFRCPYCRRMEPILAKLLRHYPTELRLVFLYFPVVSPDSGRAAVAAEVAGWQGRFWEMHDALFALQGRPLREADLLDVAGQLGMDVERYRQDLRSPEALARVRADADRARQLGLRGTPAFFVNGRPLVGVQDYDALERIVADELRRSRR